MGETGFPELQVLERIDSTNTEALRRGREDAPEHWLLAKRQDNGRGRHGRTWQSTQGNLALSRLLRLRDQERSRASELAFITGLSAAEGIQSLASDLSVQLKWPNDVMIGDAKCGGCLVETSGSARAAMVAAIGIGVNIAHAPPIEGRKTTALAMHGSNPDPATLARSIIAAFETWLERWRGMGFEPVLRTWKAMAYGMGERLSVHIGQDTVTGRFEDIDGHGALLLKPDNAEMIRVQAGDVQAL